MHMNFNQDLNIFNDFGITPTTNFTAAGLDFYIPNLDTREKVDKWINAVSNVHNPNGFKRSYLDELFNKISASTSYNGEKLPSNTIWNIVQLYVSLYSSYIECIFDTLESKVLAFTEEYLVFDKNGNPGIKLRTLDHTLFNSGIKVALPHNTAGVFFNKSGKGTKGFSIRAQVVDEDYAGYVHLSTAYTKENEDDGIIYVGDKITQMVILPIVLVDKCNELSLEDYEELMKDSKRGSDAMGSSDIKH